MPSCFEVCVMAGCRHGIAFVEMGPGWFPAMSLGVWRQAFRQIRSIFLIAVTCIDQLFRDRSSAPRRVVTKLWKLLHDFSVVVLWTFFSQTCVRLTLLCAADVLHVIYKPWMSVQLKVDPLDKPCMLQSLVDEPLWKISFFLKLWYSEEHIAFSYKVHGVGIQWVATHWADIQWVCIE